MSKTLKNIGADLKIYYPGLLIFLIYAVPTRLIFGTMCPVAAFTGLPCPGCGITRAMLLILQAKFLDAFYMNLFAYPCMLVLLYILISRYVLDKKKLPVLTLVVLGLLMFGYWIWRMVTLYPGEAPMAYHERNALNMLRGLLQSVLNANMQ